jgi:hypothetical protein
LLSLSGRLTGLERDHAAAVQALHACMSSSSAAGPASTGTSSRRVALLEDEVAAATARLQRLSLDQAQRLGELEKLERQLASRQRTLAGLDSAVDTSAAQARALAARPATQLATSAALPAEPTPVSAEEQALRGHVAGLAEADTRAAARFAAARASLSEADKKLSRLEDAARQMLTLESLRGDVRSRAATDMNQWLAAQGLPPCHGQTPSADSHRRFSAYLEHFTDLAPDPASGETSRRLKPEFEDRSFMVLAALHDVSSPGVSPNPFPGRLLHALDVSHGPALADAMAKNDHRAMSEALVTMVAVHLARAENAFKALAATSSAEIAGLPRRQRMRGGNLARRDTQRVVANMGELAGLMARHGTAITNSAIRELVIMLLPTIHRHDDLQTNVKAARSERDALKQQMQDALGESMSTRKALAGARADLQEHVAGRRRASGSAARTSGEASTVNPAAIPQTTQADGADKDARIAKLRGEIEVLGEQVEAARRRHAEVGDEHAATRRNLRKTEQALDQAAAEHGRESDAAQRGFLEARAQQAAQRARVHSLAAEVEQARASLTQHPALAEILLPEALTRAIERHVQPDDAALHARARAVTGHAGAYNSLGHMVEAVVDVHTAAARKFPDVFQARNAREFALAAAAAGGVTDLRHVHDRPTDSEPLARGFSNAPDQTTRPTPVNESSYSLCWHQGRVVVSHVFPYVPHRGASAT